MTPEKKDFQPDAVSVEASINNSQEFLEQHRDCGALGVAHPKRRQTENPSPRRLSTLRTSCIC
jgi:hypothetical protein